MMTSPRAVSKPSATLAKRAGTRTIVRIRRAGLQDERLDAYVLATSKRLALLQPVRDRIDLDGYDVIRLEDVTGVEDCPRAEFFKRALALKRQRPRLPRARIDLANMSRLLRSVDDAGSLLVISREFKMPGECEIGRLLRLKRETYQMRWITPGAEWEADDRVFRLSDITRVQFGGAYERTLADVAGLVSRL
jgi:hypothetical protein